MNRFYKGAAALAGAMVALGVVLALTGTILGGRFLQMQSYMPGFFVSVPLLAAPEDDNWGISGSGDYFETFQGVTSISLDSGMAHAEIKTGDTFSVKAEGIERYRFGCRVENGTLTVNCKPRSSSRWYQNRNNAPKVIITVPKGFVAQELDLNVGMGSLKTSGLKSKECDLTVGMGEAVLEDFASEGGELECGMGTIDLEGTLTGKQAINCGMGSVTIKIAGSEADYDYTADVGVGRVEVGQRGSGGLGKEFSRSSGAIHYLNIECGMGDVTISFE